jgi:hypothetical protein
MVPYACFAASVQVQGIVFFVSLSASIANCDPVQVRMEGFSKQEILSLRIITVN